MLRIVYNDIAKQINKSFINERKYPQNMYKKHTKKKTEIDNILLSVLNKFN